MENEEKTYSHEDFSSFVSAAYSLGEQVQKSKEEFYDTPHTKVKRKVTSGLDYIHSMHKAERFFRSNTLDFYHKDFNEEIEKVSGIMKKLDLK